MHRRGSFFFDYLKSWISLIIKIFCFRFEQERGFKGADKSASRDGPVQFQREEDPFGLNDFFKDVRHGGASGSAPSANPSSSSKRGNGDDREERTSEKRRKK